MPIVSALHQKSKEDLKMDEIIKQIREGVEQMSQEQRKSLLEFIDKLKKEEKK